MTATVAGPCPVDVPGPGGDTPIAREPLWFAFATGEDRPVPPPWTRTPQPPPDTHRPPPSPVPGPAAPLPAGTVDRLAAAPYPHGRMPGAGPERALVAAFAVQRREPDNPFADHRPYASARCLFPVRAFLACGGPTHLLDPDRHGLVALPGPRRADRREIVLAGHYPVVPLDYRFFRGSLVALELGIALRSLAVALELSGIGARVRPPGPDGVARLRELGLAATHDWSLPLVVELDGGAGAVLPEVAEDAPRPGDPVLAAVLRADRAQAATRCPAVPLTGAIPPGDIGSDPPDLSWAEVLWRRSSGRMPRRLHGMTTRRRPLPAPALAELVRWGSVPAPGFPAGAVRLTAVLQGVDGVPDGVHRVRDGGIVAHRADPDAAARLEDAYFYGPTPGSGCDLRHAPATFLLSVRPRDLVREHGPGAWARAQQACGWIAHGLCLAAAAAGLVARPVRAFREPDVQRLAGLDPDETLVLAVVTGVPRPHAGPLLDIRI